MNENGWYSTVTIVTRCSQSVSQSVSQLVTSLYSEGCVTLPTLFSFGI